MTAMMVAFVAYLAQYVAEFASLTAMALGHIDLGDTVSWGALAGVFTPLLTSIVQRPNWTKQKRTVVGVLVSVVIGVLTCLADGSLDHAATVLMTLTAVVVASAATYKTLWQPSGIAGGIENATSPQSSKTSL
jgi:hypothetical protein